jgi:CHAD domain-containing protein
MTRFRGDVLEGRDPEAVHQMRVASRRLRAAISFFRGELPRRERRRAMRAVRRVTRILGEIRQLDVSAMLLDRVIEETPPLRDAAGFARPLLAADRARALQHVRERIARFPFGKVRRRVRRFGRGIADVDRDALSARMGEDVSRRARRWAGLWGDNGAGIGKLPSQEQKLRLHAMRIATKNLRYRLEAGAAVCGWKVAPALHAARSLQAVLGELHDLEMLRHWCEGKVEEAAAPMMALADHLRERERVIQSGVGAHGAEARNHLTHPLTPAPPGGPSPEEQAPRATARR